MKYVYGIAPAAEMPALLSITGLNGATLEAVKHNGVTAIVSDAVPYDYAGLPKQQLVKVLAQHQQATERIMQHTPTLLPVKFGTLLQLPDVHKLLAQSSTDFEQALSKVAGHVEFELVVMWDPQRVFSQIAQEPEIAELRSLAAGLTTEELQRLQVALGVRVKQMLDARKANYEQKIRDALTGLADDMEANAITNDQVVANLALLLPADREAELDQRINALDAALGGELAFKVVGPLPAYSFSTVEVEQVLANDVAWAKQQLEIHGETTGEEIRAAYLRAARRHHPDNNASDALAVERFKEVHAAYRLLRYCHATQHRAAGVDVTESTYRCDLTEAAEGGMLMVTICRSSELAAR